MAKSAILVFGILLAFQPLTISAQDQAPTSPGFPDLQETNRSSQAVIQDPAEYNAYMMALNTQDPVQKAILMEEFLRVYPQSVVKLQTFEYLMAAYQQAGNTAKAEATAERILAINHDHLRALLISAYAKRSRSAAQGDAAQARTLAKTARTLAEHGLQVLPKAKPPQGVSHQEFDKQRHLMAAIFNGAAGYGALQNKEYAQARQYYLESDLTDLQNVFQLGTADLEMEPLDITGFWYVIRAANLARAQKNEVAARAIEGYGKGKYQRYHGGPDGWDELLRRFGSVDHPPDGFSVSRYQPPASRPANANHLNSGNANHDLNRGPGPRHAPCAPPPAGLQRTERVTPGGVPASATSFGSDSREHGVPASISSPINGQAHGVPASVTSIGTDCIPNGVPASIASFSDGVPHGVPASVTSPVDGKSHGVPASIASPVDGKPLGVPASVTSIGADGSLHGIPASVVSPVASMPVFLVVFGDPHAQGYGVVPVFRMGMRMHPGETHPGSRPKIAALKSPSSRTASSKSLSAKTSPGTRSLVGR